MTAQLCLLIRLIDGVNRAVFRLTSWLTLAMVLVGAYNALARYFDRAVSLRLSSNSWVESQWYLFSIVFLFAAPWALRKGAHVRVDVLYGRFTERARAWIDLVGAVAFLLPFCVFAIWLSWPSVRDSIAVWETSPDPGGLARWPIKSAVPLAFVLLFLQGIAEALRRGLYLFAAVPAADLELFEAAAAKETPR